jgi:hypothetical protein
MVRPARSLLTEDEIAFLAYLKELRGLIAQGVIREEDPFPEDVEPVEDDEGYEDEDDVEGGPLPR